MLNGRTSSGLPTLGRRSEEILFDLRGKMDTGAYAPNTRLPSEHELCEIFKVSRTTVRRALTRLVHDGRLEVIHGSGAYVLPVPKNEHPSCTISVMFPFDGASLAHAQQTALDLGYLISVFTHTDWSAATERKFLERVLQERHKALLAFCTPHPPGNDDLLDEIEKSGTRVIHVEHYRTELPSRSYVLPDYRRGGAIAANAMMIAGYDSFRFIQIEGDGPYVPITYEGFVESLHEQREELADEEVRVVLPPSFETTREGLRAWKSFLSKMPRNTGILARSESLAEVVAELLRKSGMRIPEDFGVIGLKQLLHYCSGGSTDHVDFDWGGLLRDAIEAAASPAWKGIRSLYKPRLIRTGTLRK